MKNAIRRALAPKNQTKTRIMATVGRTAMEYQVLRDLVESGATFFRFNGAHIEEHPEGDDLSYAEAREIAKHIRRLRNEFRQLICIYFDLGGPKIRVHRVLGIQRNKGDKEKDNWFQPTEGEIVVMHAWSAKREREFKEAREAFERDRTRSKEIESFEREKSKQSRSATREFFEWSRRTEGNELMLGREVTTFAGFDHDKPINLKDGWCRLKILKHSTKRLVCEVEYVDSKFEFYERQGANPKRHIFPEIITSKDKRDIEEAIIMGADIVSLSFVCAASDGDDLRKLIKEAKKKAHDNDEFMKGQTDLYHRYVRDEHEVPIFAKIETAYAVDSKEAIRFAKRKGLSTSKAGNRDPLHEIAEKFDGLMVARGDLAVEVEKYEVPELQRRIIKIAHLKNKPVIVATEMLESMKLGNASTRAEISDINTAVHQEADILMLSGETASTRGRPAAAVREMRNAIEQAEKDRWKLDIEKNFEELQNEREGAIKHSNEKKRDKSLTISRLAQGNQVCVSARALSSEAIITSVKTGQSVIEISFYHPSQKIVAITDDMLIGARLLQHRGIYPVVVERPLKRTIDEFLDIINEIHHELRLPAPAGSKTSFKVPGLVRIRPEFPNGLLDIEAEIPNSIHVFTLPVTPRSVPETERKYILSKESFEKLRDDLIESGSAARWRLQDQRNYYFTDARRILTRARVLLRVRAEELKEEWPRSDQTFSLHNTRIFFTHKEPAKQSDRFGAEQRPEKEFDVTRELGGQTAFSQTDFPDLNMLPPFYRSFVWERNKQELRAAYRGATQVKYEPLTNFLNYRYTFDMNNGFTFELDESHFVRARDGKEFTEYQLEVELREDERLSKVLDEYINDKFSRLGIPIVQVDLSKMSRSRYPTKVVQALAFAGCIDYSVLRPMRTVKEKMGLTELP